MKAIKYFTAMAALIAWTACTDDLNVDNFASDPNAVRIHVSVGEPFARSNPAGDATTVTQFNDGDKLSISTNNQDAAVYTFDGTSWNPVSLDNYLIWENNKQRFTAYYPSDYKGSGNVPTAQNTDKGIAAADYMKFEGELDMQKTVSFTMTRQTARVVISSDFSWNEEYTKDGLPTHKVKEIKVNCVGVNNIETYHPDNYYALVNPGAADSETTFITLTVTPLEGESTPIIHTVKGIPAFQAGHSYTYRINIGKNVVSIHTVEVEDWETGGVLSDEVNAEELI